MGKYDAYKEEVLAVARRLSEDGYFGTRSGTAGNVSMLVEAEDAIAVTPADMSYQTMTPDDICIVDFDEVKREGRPNPSKETPMHLAVYKHRPDVSAVIHSHQPSASVLAVLNEPIPPLFDEVTFAIGKDVTVVPYGLSGSPDLINNVASKLDNRCHCYLLQNHGALCIGKSLQKTLTYVELLEKTAAIYVRALSTGRPVTTLPAPLAEALHGIVMAEQDAEIARKEALRQPAS